MYETSSLQTIQVLLLCSVILVTSMKCQLTPFAEFTLGKLRMWDREQEQLYISSVIPGIWQSRMMCFMFPVYKAHQNPKPLLAQWRPKPKMVKLTINQTANQALTINQTPTKQSTTTQKNQHTNLSNFNCTVISFCSCSALEDNAVWQHLIRALKDNAIWQHLIWALEDNAVWQHLIQMW